MSRLILSAEGISDNPGTITPEIKPSLEEKMYRMFVDRCRALANASMGIAEDYQEWLRRKFPKSVSSEFGQRHTSLWEWMEGITPNVRAQPRVDIWPRGGGKSSTIELGLVRMGTGRRRRFALYVSATQGQANRHVQAIGMHFESLEMPRALNRYGNSLGWRVDMLRVSNGFNCLALGLDAAARGVKLGDDRPDIIVFDDIDSRHDTEEMIKRKVETITESILPSGTGDCAILFLQNRIHKNSIVSTLADGTADFLHDRSVHEEKAVEGLEIEAINNEDGTRSYAIRAGTPTWEGQDLDACEFQLNAWGRAAFLREAQHETEESDEGLWLRVRDIDPFRVGQPAQPNHKQKLARIGVAIDPNVTSKKTSDEAGIMVGGIYRNEFKTAHGILLEDCTVGGGPKAWAQAAVAAYHRWEADVMVAEANNGGEMVAITISTVERAPPVTLVNASRGKIIRAEPVQKLSEDGRIHHKGVFVDLEDELCNWKPGMPSPNRLDAYVWLWTEMFNLQSDKGPAMVGVVYSGMNGNGNGSQPIPRRFRLASPR
ncbi:MAG: hypothetical protein WDA12_04950 [Bacilli bacterium]